MWLLLLLLWLLVWLCVEIDRSGSDRGYWEIDKGGVGWKRGRRMENGWCGRMMMMVLVLVDCRDDDVDGDG